MNAVIMSFDSCLSIQKQSVIRDWEKATKRMRAVHVIVLVC